MKIVDPYHFGAGPIILDINEEEAIKSIGNSLTVYRDLVNEDDVEIVIWLLADSVASRMREAGLNKARTVQLYVRDCKLYGYQKQGKLPHPTNNMGDIAKFAFKLFKEIYPWNEYIRGLGISVTDFVTGDEQLDMFGDMDEGVLDQSMFSENDAAFSASSPSSPMNADPGRSSVSLCLRNLSFSMSAEVTRFSLVPLLLTVNPWAERTLRPDSLTIDSMPSMLGASMDLWMRAQDKALAFGGTSRWGDGPRRGARAWPSWHPSRVRGGS